MSDTQEPEEPAPTEAPAEEPAQTQAPPSPVAPEHAGPSLTRTALPVRVKSGEFSPQFLAVETANGRIVLPWQQVQLICLGIIEEGVGHSETQKSGLRSMVRKVLFGESNSNQSQKGKVRETLLLDVFIVDQTPAYRFDAGTVNYRSFLGEASYISAQNFQRLVSRIVYYSSDSRLDASTVAYLSMQKSRMRRYGAVYDFELESANNRDRLANLMARGDLEIAQMPASTPAEEGAWDASDAAGASAEEESSPA